MGSLAGVGMKVGGVEVRGGGVRGGGSEAGCECLVLLCRGVFAVLQGVAFRRRLTPCQGRG